MARAQAEDILHATPFSTPVRVWGGEYPDLEGAEAVVLACGVAQPPRREPAGTAGPQCQGLRGGNPKVLKSAPVAVLLVASNPVDIITTWSARYPVCRPGDHWIWDHY